MAVLIDTDVLIEWERGRAPRLPADEECSLSVITASEILHGVHRATGATQARRAAFVEYILAELPVMPVTTEAARAHARTWATMESRGELIGAHDLWIAATALAHDLGLATRNAAEFERVEGLRVIDLR